MVDMPNESGGAKPEAKPKRRRWVGRVIAGVIVLVLAVVLVIPTAISSGAGTRFVMGIINKKIPGNVEIDTLTLGWFSGQSVSGVRLEDPTGRLVIELESLRLPDVSLGALLFGSRDLGEIDLMGVKADIQQGLDGTTNLQRALQGLNGPSGSKGKKGDPAKSDAAFSLEGLRFQLAARDIDVEYAVPSQPVIELKVAEANVDLKNPREITVDLPATLVQGEKTGAIDLKLTATNLFDRQGRMSLKDAAIQADSKISTFPIDSLDSMLHQDGKLVALLGPTLDARLNAMGKIDSLELTMSASSETLMMEADLSSDGETFTASRPAKVAVKITPGAWELLTRDEQGHVNSRLLEPFTLDVELSQFNAPIQRGQVDYANAAVELNVAANSVQIDAEGIGEVGLNKANVVLQSDRLGSSLVAHVASVATLNGKRGDLMVDANVTDWLTADNKFNQAGYASSVDAKVNAFPLASMLDDVLGKSNLYMLALGNTVDANVKGNYKAAERQGTLRADISTVHGKVDIAVRITPSGYELTQDTAVSYVVQPDLVTQLAGSRDLSVLQPMKVTFSLEKFDVQNTSGPITPSQVTAGFTLRVDNVVPANPTFANLNVSNITAYMPPTTRFSGDIPIEISAKIRDKINVADVSGNVAFAFEQNQWDKAQLRLTRLNINDLPVLTLDDLAKQNGALVALLGPTLNSMRLETTGDPRQDFKLAANVESDSLMAVVGGQLMRDKKGVHVSLRPDSKVTLELTPQRYANFMNRSGRWQGGTTPVRITGPATMTFSVVKGDVPLPFDPQQTMIDVRLSSTPLDLQREGSGNFRLTDISGGFSTTDLTQSAVLRLNADIASGRAVAAGGSALNAGVERGVGREEEKGKEQVGKVNVNAQVNHLFLPDGQVNKRDLVLKTNTTVQDMPIDLVDQVIKTNGDLVALIGPTGNIKLNGMFPGDIDVDIQSETLNVPAYVNVTRDYVLRLRENFDARITPTEQTFSALLAKAQPALADAISSEKPIHLVVNKEGFMVPLTDFKMQNLNMTGTLDLGELRMKRSGWLMQSFTGALRNLGLPVGQDRNTPSYSAMFTPMSFSVKDGMVEPSQVWMISEDLAIGFQIRANLNTGRLNAFMGILGASFILQNPAVFSASFNADQVYSIPLRGSITNPQPDYGFLAINIAGTTGTKIITDNTGDLGGLIGGIVGGVGQSVNDDKLRRAGLKSWKVPPQAQAVVERAQSEDVTRINPQQEQGGRQREQQRRSNPINDALRDLFGG